jgi:hypothetical protein
MKWNQIKTSLISRVELTEQADRLVAGTYGDPLMDKLMDEFMSATYRNEHDFKLLIKRVYYLGILEGSRRFKSDPRVMFKRDGRVT